MVDVMQSTVHVDRLNNELEGSTYSSDSNEDQQLSTSQDLQQQTDERQEDINLSILHPLEYEWTFWYDKRQNPGRRVRGEQEAYESNLRPIGSFGTVEDFWRYYNYIVKPSRMENNANQHLFKKNIKPMWEDAANVKGGKWIVILKGDKAFLDATWDNLVLALVGETLEAGDDICGAVVSRRKTGDKIAIWNKDKTNEPLILNLGRKLKAILGLDRIKLTYQYHEDSMKSGASYSNPDKYVL
jgi:translation initiation factor 4E